MDKELLLHLFDKGRIGDDFDKTFDELIRLGYLETVRTDERWECQYKLTPKAHFLLSLRPPGPVPSSPQ